MKITVNVDCTPEEARTFLGLPDLRPMQEAVLAKMQEQMLSGLHSMDPETMLKTWVPMSVQGLEQMQKMFWNQFSKGPGGSFKE